MEQTRFTSENEIAQLNNDVIIAKEEYERQKKLFQEKVISKNEYTYFKREYELKFKKHNIARRCIQYDPLSSITQIARINSSINRMYNNLEMTKKNLKQLYIKAPIADKVSNFQAEFNFEGQDYQREIDKIYTQ